MNIVITKFENPILEDNEKEFCQHLSSLVKSDDIISIKNHFDFHKQDRKSFFYSEVESDISSFYELNKSQTVHWLLRPKFIELERTQIKTLLIQRIESINDGEIEFPEKLFEPKTIRIEFQGKFKDVIEVTREDWDFILYKSKFTEREYFVSIVFGTIGTWEEIFQLSEIEIKIVESENRELLKEMVNRKRAKNWL